MGVRESDDVVLRNKLKVFNIAITTILFISAFYGLIAITKSYHLSTWTCLYSVLCCLTVFVFVTKRKFDLAFHFSMWYGLSFLAMFSFIFGPVTNSHYYFLFLPIVTLILFDNPKTITAYFIVSVLVMLGSVFMMDFLPPYYDVELQERWLGYPNIPFVMLLTFLAVRLFKNENRKYAIQIEQQHATLEEKNKEVTDSINYARRIQSALLAPAALLKKNVPDHFVLYKPKDIVSGDFYWAAESDSKFWLCVGDCTGHGVPGAFMSLLNISILRELIVEQKVSRPDFLLNKQRDQIIKALNPDGAEEKAKDGMDCSIALFDFANNKIEFSCSNNPVWIMRAGVLHEFKPDKQPVGIHEGEMKPFSLHSWEIQKGDCVYMFTDGFADQFGGPRGKKYKYAQLKDKIVSLSGKTIAEHGHQLDASFTEWKGELVQVDDVLIVGIQL